nr:MAG TPA: hypothetical protein [Caudoviricetes sp.]
MKDNLRIILHFLCYNINIRIKETIDHGRGGRLLL